MWAHQYDQQVNQVGAAPARPDVEHQRPGVEHLRRGAELRLLHGQPQPGLAEVRRAPVDGNAGPRACRGRMRRAGSIRPCKGQAVTVGLDTDYPFRETLRFRVTAAAPVRFPLRSAPAWAQGAEVCVAGEAATSAQPGSFHRVEREWAATEVVLHLPMRPALVTQPRIRRGRARAAGLRAAHRGGLAPRHAEKPYRELPTGLGGVSHDAVELCTGADSQIAFIEQPMGAQSPRWRARRSSRRRMAAACVGDGERLRGELPAGPVTSGEPLEPLR